MSFLFFFGIFLLGWWCVGVLRNIFLSPIGIEFQIYRSRRFYDHKVLRELYGSKFKTLLSFIMRENLGGGFGNYSAKGRRAAEKRRSLLFSLLKLELRHYYYLKRKEKGNSHSCDNHHVIGDEGRKKRRERRRRRRKIDETFIPTPNLSM